MTSRTFCAALLLLPAHMVLADPSLECSVTAGSQVEIADCLVKVEKASEEALGIVLKMARDNATELDMVTERNVALPALDAAQSAWETYRNTTCDYEGALFGGGSGTGIAIQSCLIELTRARTRQLENALR